jgi:predicted nucleotidyltransferase
MTEKILFITEVGSTMWGMEDLASDRDRIVIFQEPTRAILRGEDYPRAKPQRRRDEGGIVIDEQFMEIGHLIDLLCRGNVNAIWAVVSPIIIQDHPICQHLRNLVTEEMSQATAASVRGMAASQERDSTRRPVLGEGKGYRTALRTLRFGITMLNEERFAFKPVPPMVAADLCSALNTAKIAFEMAVKTTILKERPDEERFRQLLYEIRMAGLMG